MLNTNKYKRDKCNSLTRKERFAFRELINNPHIVINKADKGSVIVVEDRDEHISNEMIHLNDPKVYKPLHTDIYPTLIIEKLLKQAWFEFCKPPKQTHTSRLYFLKIHKNPMGIRPIVSSCNSITKPISQFVDRWLQPHVKNLLSYLKDSTEFLKLIETTKIPSNCILASYPHYTLISRTRTVNKMYYTICKIIQTTTHDPNNQYQRS